MPMSVFIEVQVRCFAEGDTVVDPSVTDICVGTTLIHVKRPEFVRDGFTFSHERLRVGIASCFQLIEARVNKLEVKNGRSPGPPVRVTEDGCVGGQRDPSAKEKMGEAA